jgi:hypothetical protein
MQSRKNLFLSAPAWRAPPVRRDWQNPGNISEQKTKRRVGEFGMAFWSEGIGKPDSVPSGKPEGNDHSSGPAVAGEIDATVPGDPSEKDSSVDVSRRR